MASVKIVIKDWDKLKKSLSADKALERLIPDISISVLKLHNVLERRVGDLFNNPKELSSVRIGNSLAPEKVGRSLLRYGLQYRSKYVPLADYLPTIGPSASISKAPLRNGAGFIKWTTGAWSKETKAAVRKGKSGTIPLRKKIKARKGFFFKNTETGRTHILSRLHGGKHSTWSTFPSQGSDGERNKVAPILGPTLAYLAEKVYDKDSQVATAIAKMYDEIEDSFVRSYD